MPEPRNPSVFNIVGNGRPSSGGIENDVYQAVNIIRESSGSTGEGLPKGIHWALVKPGPELTCKHFLTETEIEDGQRYRHPGRYQQWLLGRATAKFLLVKHAKTLGLQTCSPTGFEILRNPDGWPQVRNRRAKALPISLTISHTGDLAFCALCHKQKGTLGADLETITPKSPSMLEDFYTRDERRWLCNLPNSEQALAATLIWCAKEAVLKAQKTGLMENTKNVEVELGDFNIHNRTDWNQAKALLQNKPEIRVWWRIYKYMNLCLTLARMSTP